MLTGKVWTMLGWGFGRAGFGRGRRVAAAAGRAAQPERCFHCGLPLPAPVPAWLEFAGAPRPMCCASCLAAAQLIIDAGHAAYYAARLADADAAPAAGDGGV
ncbi:MAG: heavy metal translocating P-type ATPase metal-binding domain-containing protein [Burkholderiales bacterium]|nr:heavy metal translocating P-type ATPase metal-binding domain-containing protein [Burkholderiales bacterium]